MLNGNVAQQAAVQVTPQLRGLTETLNLTLTNLAVELENADAAMARLIARPGNIDAKAERPNQPAPPPFDSYSLDGQLHRLIERAQKLANDASMLRQQLDAAV